MPEPAAPWRSTAVPAVWVSIFNVTARPPPLVSLAVEVPGPASSNGNLNLSVWAEALPAGNSMLTRIANKAASERVSLFRGESYPVGWVNIRLGGFNRRLLEL